MMLYTNRYWLITRYEKNVRVAILIFSKHYIGMSADYCCIGAPVMKFIAILPDLEAEINLTLCQFFRSSNSVFFFLYNFRHNRHTNKYYKQYKHIKNSLSPRKELKLYRQEDWFQYLKDRKSIKSRDLLAIVDVSKCFTGMLHFEQKFNSLFKETSLASKCCFYGCSKKRAEKNFWHQFISLFIDKARMQISKISCEIRSSCF